MSKKTDTPPPLELVAARFAYAGAAVTTLGDLLATIAAGITLQIVEENITSNLSNNKNAGIQDQDLQQMNEQIEYLILELRQIKKFLQK